MLWAAAPRAGVAKADITPAGPIWLSGYASRTKASEGAVTRLWAKALALEDGRGERLVVVTTDLIGLPKVVTDVVGARVLKEFGLDRPRLLLNSSHTHTGPVVRPNLALMYDLNAEQERVIREYTNTLTDTLVKVTGEALANLRPAVVSWGEGQASFGVNRREHTPKGVRLGVNTSGPADRSVPVLKVAARDGKTMATLFGYACHNTTLTGEHYSLSGDFAGYAQAELEKSLDGGTAMFMQLCAGDQNPQPRGEERIAEQHGRALAAEVKRVLDGRLTPLKLECKAALQWVDLPFAPHSREDFEKMLGSSDKYRVRLGKAMLQAYDERRAPRSVAFPVQALRIAKDTVFVALGGEPVVEYALKTKAAHPKLRLAVAGYSNDVMGYLPTAAMLTEGGYEPVTSSVYYGLPAPFAPEVERTVLDATAAAIRRVR